MTFKTAYSQGTKLNNKPIKKKTGSKGRLTGEGIPERNGSCPGMGSGGSLPQEET